MNATHTAPPPTGSRALGTSLRRSSENRLLLGLCAGVAHATRTNVTAVRAATLVLGALLLPVVVLAYLVSAAILPRDDETVLIGSGPHDKRDVVVAVICTCIGAPLVLGTAAATGLTTGDGAWPLLLVAAGLALGVALYRPKNPTLFETGPAGGAVSLPAVNLDKTMVRDAPTATAAAAPTDAPAEPAAQPQQTTGPTFVTTPRPTPGSGEPKPRGLALPVIAIMGLIPAAFALLTAIGIIDGGWTTWSVMVALLAIAAAGGAVAIALLRPSFLGAGFLVILAAFLGVLSIAVSQAGPVLGDGVGDRTVRPAAASDLLPLYTLGVGQLSIDLRGLDLRPGSTTTVHAKIGYGVVRIAVPRGVRVVAARGSETPDLALNARSNGASAATSAAAPVIAVDVSAKAGAAQLLGGSSRSDRTLDELRVLSEQNTGIWTGSSRAPAPVNRP